MRRRLTVAILVLVAATLIVTTVSSYVFIRRAVITTSQRELNGEAQAISHSFSNEPKVTRAGFVRQLRVVTKAGDYAGISVVELLPDGSIVGTIPSGLTLAQLDVPALRQGLQTSGHTRSLLVYTAVPTPVARETKFVPVLIVTRQAHDPANGLRYFALIGAIGLAVAALVAAGLARRFSRPVVSAVAATQRIASGDLDARVTVTPHELPEFAQLAGSINTMGANLVRARDQERQFLLSVSHELRTPLTSIRGYADAVVDGTADDPVAAAVVITTEARRLERLVEDLLDLARFDADRFSLDLRPVDATEVAATVVQGFQHRAAELGLELTLAPGSDGPIWVQADDDRLGQVVANLVENAASFADRRIVVGVTAVVPDGTGPTVGTTTQGTDGSVPAVWVVDDGPGIRPEELPRVFDRHFSSDRTPGRRKGSGLGLAIVSELAGAMGATVRAESPAAEGHGTRMVVWLRSAAPHPRTRSIPGLPQPAEPGRPSAMEVDRQGVILVTGASSGIGRACADRLEHQGWTVVGASRSGTTSGGWVPLVMDVDRDASVAAGVESTLDHHGRLDAVVACAGWGLAGSVEQTPIDEARAQLETNFWGAVRVVQRALPLMRAARGGRIVLVSSIGGVVGLPFQAFYTASKFAMEGFGEALAYEVAPFGIHVTLVQPGNVRTDFTARRRRVPAPDGDDPYGPAATRAIEVMAEDESNGVAPDRVAAVVQRVLESKRPPRHVSVGKADERVGIWAKRVLPYRVFERAAKGSLGV